MKTEFFQKEISELRSKLEISISNERIYKEENEKLKKIMKFDLI